MRRFLFDDQIISLEEARSFIVASQSSFAERGYGLWLFFEQPRIVPPEIEPIAGFAGLLDSSEASPSLIFGTAPQLWQRGYAREAAAAVLRYAFDQRGLKRVIADVDEPNIASIRVLEALGMRQTRRSIVNDRPLLYYESRN
jgi:RimJ/RimL family protein N-acetyltransferase